MSKKNKVKDSRKTINIEDHIKTVDVGIKDGVFVFTSPLSVIDLSKRLNKSPNEIIKFFFMKGNLINLNSFLNEEQIGELCLEYNLDFKIEKEVNESNLLDNINFNDDENELELRPPIVTIMGHVDHGKTTLLDAIRKSNLTSDEAGGITQSIGAYQVELNNKKITFIDTPGHEAFSEMRARGANVTDIVVLVVAADDGIKVQTQEAIDHAKAAGVEIIVFINKIDKPNANVEKIMSQLSEYDIISEKWGGNTIFVEGSALQKTGINELLQSILLISDINQYKADYNRLAFGTVIESNLDKGYGPMASVLIQNGTLKKSDYIIIGKTYGKIRLMFDENGKEVDTATPSTPIKIAGLENIPNAGDKFLVLNDEKKIKELVNQIKIQNTNFDINTNQKNNINSKELNIIIKTDVQGMLEAIKNMINKISIDGTHINLVRGAVGGITETDVRLAQASNALIIGFNVRPNRIIRDLLDQTKIIVKTYNIIYKLKEDLENLLIGKLDPVIVEEINGEATVQQIWKHSDIGTICGCIVNEGKIKRNSKARVIRDGVVIYDSEIATLQHGKNSVNEILSGNECGLTIKNFNDIKENDTIESYNLVEKTHQEINKNDK